jgi:hypothetical protein
VLVVTADDGTRQEIAVSGFGLGRGELVVAPGTIEFGLQELRVSEVRPVTVRNVGTAAFTVGTLSLEPRVPEFAVIDRQGCANAQLDPGETCTIGVQFAPLAPDTRQATLVVTTSSGRALVTLSGAGRAPRPPPVGNLVFKPDRLDFGEQTLPSAIGRVARPPVAASQTFTASNLGDGDVLIDEVFVEPGKSSREREFAVQNSSCRGVLRPRETCSVSLVFRAMAPGSRGAAVVIRSNAPQNPHRVSLAGFGREATPPDGDGNRCADLVAENISFDVLTRRSQFEADIQITGRARNRGPGVVPGGTIALFEGGNVVRQQPISSMGPDQTVSVIYRRRWNSSSPSEGEFPPRYRLTVNIQSDCNPKNNLTERDGGEINRMLSERPLPTDPSVVGQIPIDPRRVTPRGADPAPAPLPVIVQFVGQDRAGQPRRLCYAVKGAVRARIEPRVGPVPPSVNTNCVAAPAGISQFVLIAENADGRAAKSSVTMQVPPQRLRQDVPDRIVRE